MKKDKSKVAPPINENVYANALKEAKVVLWDSYVPLIVEDDYKQLNPKTPFIDTTNKTFTLSDITAKKYKLVMRYSFVDCDQCVNAVLKQIKEAAQQNSIKDAIAITTSASARDFLIRARETPCPVTLYNIPDGSVGLHMENRNFPFLFVLTPEGRAIKIFMPAKENIGQLKEYLTKALSFVNTSNHNAKFKF
ncbi:hypothetical protein [Mucilaginibacter sp. UYCu711]|uniref:hypothetical protein n=1 Tax=Mucilaginibacter sp. UYCu711 TaxID=3156339 RepID=UPI003D24B5C4